MADPIVTDPNWFDDAMTAGVVVVQPGWTDDGDAFTLAGVSRPAPTAAPTVTALSPATAVHTDPPLDVVITGTGFAYGDRVVFGGATPPTGFHSDTELVVRVEPAMWQPGTLDVLVGVSAHGPSNSVPFTIT